MFTITTVLVISIFNTVHSTQSHSYVPSTKVNFCEGNKDITSIFYYGQDFYDVFIKQNLTAATLIKLQLDSIGTVVPSILHEVRFTAEEDLVNNIFSFVLLDSANYFSFVIKGKPTPHHPPYIISLKINGKEECRNANLTYFENYSNVIKRWPDAPDKSCGRRRITKESIPLIVSGTSTQAGHWPWHAAINKITKGLLGYICGGTLISKYMVLTAAHCVTIRGVPLNPDVLGVVLGKHNLHRIESTNQDREVDEVLVHDEFNKKSFNNDIALLKLNTEATFNNFVQPACIWFDGIYDHLPSLEITGTVVGWGLDQSSVLSKKLRAATLPIVPEVTCIRYEPVFYTKMLNGKKFCAGYNNGTSACNGDSGGGYLVFVEDDRNYSYWGNYDGEKPGAWYVRGIVSNTLKREDADICDPDAYTLYTDVAQYRDWILSYM